MRSIRAVGLLLLALLVLHNTRAEAKILLAIPLGSVLSESKLVLVTRVESLDPDKLQAVLTVSEALKGKADFAKLPVLLVGDAEAKKDKQVPQLLKRVQVGMPVVLFVNQREREFVAFGFTDGTWFQMTGTQPKDADFPRWAWGHFEPVLRQTFKGTTGELRELVVDVLAGKKKAPEVNKKEAPGIGPEITPKTTPGEKQGFAPAHPAPARTGGPLLGVIPTVLVGGPLAFLALLFPAVFGGLILVANRWMVALSVISTNCTLYFFHSWLAPSNPTAWLAPAPALWMAMTLVTFLGAWWAWQRRNALLIQGFADSHPAPKTRPVEPQRDPTPSLFGTGQVTAAPTRTGVIEEPASAAEPSATTPVPPVLATPGRGERITFAILGLLSLLWAFAIPTWAYGLSMWDRSLGSLTLWDKFLLTLLVGVLAAGVQIVIGQGFGRRSVSGGMPGEGVLLLTMLLASILFLPTLTAGESGAVGAPGVGVQTATGDGPKLADKVVWRYRPAEPSWIASSPVVAGNRAYVGVVHGAAFRSGAVYAIDVDTGKLLASFNNDGKMKDVFCSPTVADGCVYIGEGFHQHRDCRLYCLDAETLAKKWEFETGSHTESTPCVAGGKVYFGAGDDGLYCLDAATGKEVWHLHKLHIDSNPLVAGGKVYVGSGKGDIYTETAMVCLDAATGAELWKEPLNLPAWGGAVLAGDLLILGIGNGNFLDSDEIEKPAGAVLALNATTGRRIWRHDVQDGVHVRLATDGTRVWAAGRDRHVHCLTVVEGRKVWSRDLGAPIVASPALVPYLLRAPRFSTALGEAPQRLSDGSLIVATSAGLVTSLDPSTGASQWAFDVTRDADTPEVALFSSPAVVATVSDGVEKRRILFGCGLNGFNKGILYCLQDERRP